MEFHNVIQHELPVKDPFKFKPNPKYKKPELPYELPKKDIFGE